MHARTLPIALSVLALALPAQRSKPTLEWQKRTTTIDHGVVPLGKHTLAELEVGGQWRLGMNEASTWTLQMPILAGEAVLPPGQYRVMLQRLGEQRCAVVAQGSALALGGGRDLGVEGELAKAGKPAPKLAVEWVQDQGKAKDLLPARLGIRFGEHEWSGALTLVGGRTVKVGSWQLTAFALPAAAVAARDKAPVPVAVLGRGGDRAADAWNLVLDGDEARLVPWMVAPTDSFGFGEIQPPDAALTTTGKVHIADAADAKDDAPLALRESALKKGVFELLFAAGRQTLAVSLPEPKGKAK
jgi:hypothetical protein